MCLASMISNLFVIYLITSIIFFAYSYGFVDFNLTLSSHPVVTSFVSWTQQLAMFNRSDSVVVYLSLLLTMFVIYFFIIKLVPKSVFLWKWVAAIAVVFTLSYPLLSSDVFKYLFAARMVVDYQVNPHVVPPMAFPNDTWIRFLRWIHTPSPYGPGMTVLSIFAYVVGLQKFITALFLSKLLNLGFYFVSIYYVGKLVSNITSAKSSVIRSQLFFALNPLVLVEWLANVHNDGPMITLFLASLYYLFNGRKLKSFLLVIASISIKYVTVIILPFLFLKNKLSIKLVTIYSLILLALAPILYHYSYQYQPWYVTWLVPLAAVLGSTTVMTIIGAYTVGAFLRYLPFIATGLWQGSAEYFAYLTFGPVLIVCLWIVIMKYVRSRWQFS